MRPQYIPGILIGAGLIYLSIFGLSGILYALTGSFFRDDFDILSGWSTISTGVPATIENGALKLSGTTTTECSVYRAVSGLDAYQIVYTEAKIKMDSGDGRWYTGFYTALGSATELTYLTFTGGTVNVASDTIGHLKNVGSYTAGVYATYTMKIDRNAQTYTVEKDGVTLGSGVMAHRTTSPGPLNVFFGSTKEGVQPTNGVMSVDYVDFGTGEGPGPTPTPTPTPTPPPANKASVTVQVNKWNGTGWQGAIGVTVTVKQNGANVATWTTSSSGSTGAQQLDAGTYNFATSGAADSVNDTLTAGSTYTEQLWVGAANPNPNPNDFIAMIQQFLVNPIVQKICLYGGLAITGISALMLVMPGEKHYASPPPPPPPRYY